MTSLPDVTSTHEYILRKSKRKKKIIPSESSPRRVRKNFPRIPNKSYLESQETELVYMKIAESIGQEEEIVLRPFWCVPGLEREFNFF